MTKAEKDDFIYALGQTMKFYGKELERMQASFWWTTCKGKPLNKLKTAFLEHVKSGRYAPKPADILAIVDNMAQRGGRSALPAPPSTRCPVEIARAWMWFIGRMSADAGMGRLFQSGAGVDVSTQERYLHIVNNQAHIYDMPDAIPDEFKLLDIWGLPSD